MPAQQRPDQRPDQQQFQDPAPDPQPLGEAPTEIQPDAAGDPPAPEATALPALAIGTGVRLVSRPRYLRTADPMPMLRPPDLVDGDEIGRVVEQRPLDLLAVRFRRGTFLLTRADLQPAAFSD